METSRTSPLNLIPPAPPDPRQALTDRVKSLARRHGLAVTAVTTADPFPEVARHLDRHIASGHLAGLDWFTAERASVASDVRNLHEGAVSILSVALAYWPGPTDKPNDGIARGRISRYAWGRDYHRVIKRRLTALQAAIEADIGRELDTRRLVDTARVVERAVAARAGLGWYGKHSNLIVPGHGSWVLLGELVLDLDLVPDKTLDRNCGRCTICIDRCPTGAIVAPYTVHAPSCVSYLTIELREAIPLELRPHMGDWVYGCDVCQEVCPYTGAAHPADDADLVPQSLNNAYPSLHWLLTMTQEEFGATYHGTAVPRAKRRGLARNATVALGNIGTDADIPILSATLAGHDEPLVRGHAAWALGRLGTAGSRDALDRSLRLDPDPSVRAEARAARLCV
ncbi:MAG: tRNA epoxyqueuosine(34) reductase QueG [Chloroflexia bacterium]|nr:tRNA epoxyqueuosine(34) reductase QueG [Chloroflexia bacterium]